VPQAASPSKAGLGRKAVEEIFNRRMKPLGV